MRGGAAARSPACAAAGWRGAAATERLKLFFSQAQSDERNVLAERAELTERSPARPSPP